MAEAGAVYDALVVGLGPCGGLLANLLCSRGLRVLVVEQAPAEGLARPRAVAMDDDGMRALGELGLLEAFLTDAERGSGAQFVTPDGRFLNGLLPPDGQGRPGAWTSVGLKAPDSLQGVPEMVYFYQPRLEELLRGNLRCWGDRCTVAFGTKLVSFEEGEALVAARLRRSGAEWRRLATGEVAVEEPKGSDADPTWEVRARYLVGCDGSRSVVAQALNRGLPERLLDLQFDEEWLVIDAMLLDETALGRELPYLCVQFCDKARKATYMTAAWVTDRPQRGRHIRWEFQVLPDDDRESLASHGWLQEHLLCRWLAPSQYEIVRSAVYRFHSALAQRWRSPGPGRAFIAGDAAHQNPPFRGQGLTGGFRDAVNLSWKLALALERPELHGPLLQTYQPERYPHMRQAILDTIDTGRLIQTFCDTADGDLDKAIAANAGRGYGLLARPAVLPAGGLFAQGTAAGRLAGQACPQPRLRGRPLDALLGPGFGLLLSRAAGPAPDLPQPLLAPLGLLPLVISPEELEGSGPAEAALQRCLRGHRAVLVRPDRRVYGAVPLGAPPSAVAELLRSLHGQLGLAPPPARL